MASGLAAKLASGVTTLCHCLRLAATDGEILGFTDHDGDLVWDGTTFRTQPGLTAGALQSSADFAADDAAVEGALAAEGLDESRLSRGDYDGATMELWLVDWQEPGDRLLLRRGVLGEVTRRGARFSAEIRGLVTLLDVPKGRVFQHGCDATLGDQRCGVDLARPEYRGEGVVLAADGAVLRASGLEAYAAGWFGRGVLAWASGAMAGTRCAIAAHRIDEAGVALQLAQTPGLMPLPGDRFVATAGCDRQPATCRSKFANAINYRGFPHMPGNDFVAAYATRGDAPRA
jgi:uncharacterized phage protein (TIGR02218 family)